MFCFVVHTLYISKRLKLFTLEIGNVWPFQKALSHHASSSAPCSVMSSLQKTPTREFPAIRTTEVGVDTFSVMRNSNDRTEKEL